MLEHITPLILTYNEAPNIGRTLDQLRWARDIVIVDSFSDDETLEIVSRYPQARAVQRKFDSHANQWNFGLKETGIASEWVLSLDADYILTPGFVDELKGLRPPAVVDGFCARFVYCISGRPIHGSAYPPKVVLSRTANTEYYQDGHTQWARVKGALRNLRSPILHDDRKSLQRWIRSQFRYMELEAAKLSQQDFGRCGWGDRLRKMRLLAPFAMLLYCLFVQGVILDGRRGIYYAFQRMFAELLLSMYLLESDLAKIQGKRVGRADEARGYNAAS